MKSLLFCLLLFCILVGLCVFSTIRISEIVVETERLLNQAIVFHHAGNRIDATRCVNQASFCWEQHEDLFGMLIRHDAIDEVATEFAGLKAYANSDDDDDFFSASAKLVSSLHHVRDMECPFFRNIF